MTTEQITEALDACELGGGLAVNGTCPLHGGDNCLARYDRVRNWVTCPTCNGSGVVNERDFVEYPSPCPDCVDGMVPSPELEAKLHRMMCCVEHDGASRQGDTR